MGCPNLGTSEKKKTERNSQLQLEWETWKIEFLSGSVQL
jgi:hypothetical protein